MAKQPFEVIRCRYDYRAVVCLDNGTWRTVEGMLSVATTKKNGRVRAIAAETLNVLAKSYAMADYTPSEIAHVLVLDVTPASN